MSPQAPGSVLPWAISSALRTCAISQFSQCRPNTAGAPRAATFSIVMKMSPSWK